VLRMGVDECGVNLSAHRVSGREGRSIGGWCRTTTDNYQPRNMAHIPPDREDKRHAEPPLNCECPQTAHSCYACEFRRAPHTAAQTTSG
jgi:hypothetical protein